jgi:hypothetical protein
MDFGIYIITRCVRAIQEVTDRCYRRTYKKRTNVSVFSLSNNTLISFCNEEVVTQFIILFHDQDSWLILRIIYQTLNLLKLEVF